MHFFEMVLMEFKKTKRSKMMLLILIPPLLVVISGISSLSQYLSDVYVGAWSAMFVQSALLFGYYLLPFSMVVVCVMISGRETKNNGILKMLSLPINRAKLALSKFIVLLCYLALELVIFFTAFVIVGTVATQTMGVSEVLPIFYLLKWSIYLFATSIPSVAVMWMITILFERPLLSIGLNMLLVIPGVLVANTSLWFIYPYCYSGYLVSTELHRVSSGVTETTFELFPFIFGSLTLSSVALVIVATQFGRKEMR